MNSSVVLSIDTRAPKKDGTYPIIFRLSHFRASTSIASGFSVRKEDWDPKKRIVKNSFKGVSNPTRLNNYLGKRKAKFFDEILKLHDSGHLKTLTVKGLRERLVGRKFSGKFFHYSRQLILDLRKGGRFGTARAYEFAVNALSKFTNNIDPEFRVMNSEFLRDFEKHYLSKESNHLNGLAAYLRSVRAIYNKAKLAKLVDPDQSPFKEYSIKTTKTAKRAISAAAIMKIIQLELDRESLKLAREIFLTSFYLQGMSFADIAMLRYNAIVDGRIKYQRQRTKRPYNVKITQQLWTILKSQINGKSNKDFVFPIIKSTDPETQYYELIEARRKYNKRLKEIAKLAGIKETLTSYVSRHSFASLADEIEIPITAIRDMLGHERISTTDIYIKEVRASRSDVYQNRVIDALYNEVDSQLSLPI